MKQKASTLNGKQDEHDGLFPLGNIYVTSGVIRKVPPDEAWASLRCHLNGDWGDVDEHDWRENELALERGARLFSVYHTCMGRKFWIVTEADRSATTILLPEEY